MQLRPPPPSQKQLSVQKKVNCAGGFSICHRSRTGPGSCLTGKFEFHLAVAPDEMEGLINIYLQDYTIQTNLAPAK